MAPIQQLNNTRRGRDRNHMLPLEAEVRGDGHARELRELRQLRDQNKELVAAPLATADRLQDR